MFGNASRLFGPVPQMLLGIAMVMVLFENQRNAVQENTLALSTLGVDPRRLLFADDLVPSMQAALERLRSALPWSGRQSSSRNAGAVCCLRCSRVFLPDFWSALEKSGAGDYISELAYRQQRNLHRAAPGGDGRTVSGCVERNVRGIQEEFSPKRKCAI